MPTILSCTDGSIYARSVYDHTVWAARRLDAQVHVLHVIENSRQVAPIADLSGAIGIEAMQQLTAEIAALEEARTQVARKHAAAILTDASQHFAAAGIPVLEVESINGELVECVTRFDARSDLIVLGKRGEHANLERLNLGGNLQRVIRNVHHPVLVASRAFAPIERFLLAYDGSPSVLKAVDFALQRPLLKGLHCHLLRAGRIDEAGRVQLEQTAGRLRDAGYTVSIEAATGAPEEAILAAVKDQRIQLLVMGAFGHSRIREFILGSTTTAMVRTCLVPVLMFR